jgi:hypothetical protein
MILRMASFAGQGNMIEGRYPWKIRDALIISWQFKRCESAHEVGNSEFTI